MQKPSKSQHSLSIHAAYERWRDALATSERVEETSEEFFRGMRGLARSVVYNTIGRSDPTLEADIVTTAFLCAKNFDGLSSFGTWFWGLAYRQCLKDLRAKRRRKEVFLDDLLEEPIAPVKAGGEFIERFASLRANLSREDVKLIELRLEGYTLLEIAAQRGWNRVKIEDEWRACKNRVKKLLAEPASQKSLEPNNVAKT